MDIWKLFSNETIGINYLGSQIQTSISQKLTLSSLTPNIYQNLLTSFFTFNKHSIEITII